MNQKNLDYLKDGLKYLGFGDKLNANLEEQIKQQPAQFQLNTAGEFKKDKTEDKVEYKLDFKKSDQSDMYFFNRYEATLKNEDPAKEISQTFYITKNAGITAKEAFNLLSGRAVNKDLTNKEGQPFNAWLQLDFKEEKDKNNNFKVKQYHQGYGYDLEKALTKFSIKEALDPEQKEKMMKSLMKGNLTQVTFNKDGKEDKVFVEANPQFKNVNVYDANMKKAYQENEKKESRQEPEKSKEKKESINADDDDSPRKSKKKSKGVGV